VEIAALSQAGITGNFEREKSGREERMEKK